jgi:hypothetical protein
MRQKNIQWNFSAQRTVTDYTLFVPLGLRIVLDTPGMNKSVGMAKGQHAHAQAQQFRLTSGPIRRARWSEFGRHAADSLASANGGFCPRRGCAALPARRIAYPHRLRIGNCHPALLTINAPEIRPPNTQQWEVHKATN